MAVKIDKARAKEPKNVDLITPHGTSITVTASRAEMLLKRPPIALGKSGTFYRYAKAGESNVVGEQTTSANAPRKGSGVNSGGE